MKKIKIKYWQDDNWWLGYIEEYPDYMTQGKTLEELKENLASLYEELTDGKIEGIRKVEEIEVA
jgi:predicted RNase H-like HicB family nuclease